jgi:hypothetical protein
MVVTSVYQCVTDYHFSFAFQAKAPPPPTFRVSVLSKKKDVWTTTEAVEGNELSSSECTSHVDFISREEYKRSVPEYEGIIQLCSENGYPQYAMSIAKKVTLAEGKNKMTKRHSISSGT